MAREIRFFLFVRGSGPSVTITVQSTATDLFNPWQSLTSDGSAPSALLFAGESRPPLSEIIPLLDKRPNHLLLAASSVWLLPTRNAIAAQPIGEIISGDTYPGMPVFIAANGWGYEIE